MLVVAACVGYLIYSASGGSSEYYLTVSELRAHPAYDQDVRVAGVVQTDVLYAPRGTVEFTEKDSTASILVVYSGPSRALEKNAAGWNPNGASALSAGMSTLPIHTRRVPVSRAATAIPATTERNTPLRRCAASVTQFHMYASAFRGRISSCSSPIHSAPVDSHP